MAIRTLTSQKDRDIIGNPTYELVDLAELERLTSVKHTKPEYFETTWVGCVLSLGEHNHYDDSDFYAIVWDAAEGKPREVEYATTRGWTYANSASVDATEEVLAAYREYTERLRREAQERRAAWEATQPYVGRTVKVIKAFRSKGAKVAVGTVAEVLWYGEDKYQSDNVRMFDPQFRIGFDVAGQRVFTSAKNVELVANPQRDLLDKIAEVVWPGKGAGSHADDITMKLMEIAHEWREQAPVQCAELDKAIEDIDAGQLEAALIAVRRGLGVTPTEARQAIEAATDPKRLENARRAAVLATIDNLRDELIAAGRSARTDVSRLALVHAATELGSAREYLARGVNGNANIHLDRAHKTLTPLRTRQSLKAIKVLKGLGMV